MLRRLFLLPVALLWPAAAQPAPTSPESVVTLQPKIVARYPHDTGAFTEGLQLVGGVLYESTGLEQESSLRRVNLPSGRVEQKRSPAVAGVFAEGLTVLGKVAYQLTWQDGLAFMYDVSTLKSIGQQRYSGEGWGLTNDGKNLIMSDGSSTLTWRDPATFAPIRTVKVMAGTQAVSNLNELEYVGGQVYANVWLTNRIARIDPATGKVTAWLDLGALSREVQTLAATQGRPLGFDDVANGIAYNPARGTFLLTGKRWPLVFEVKLGK